MRLIRNHVRLAGLAWLLLLGGCDTLAHAWMINNTGAPVLLRFNVGGRDEVARLANGKGRIIMADGRGLDIEVFGCTNRYQWPKMGVNYPFEVYKDGYPLSVQVQPDLRIYILPFKTKRAQPAGSFEAGQHDGFPLSPVRRDCGGSAASSRPPA